MKTTIGKNKHYLIPTLAAAALLSLFLSACGGISMSSSPEAVAIREVSNQNGGRSGFMVDQSSIQVLQTQVVGEQTFVLLSYQGTQSSMGGAKMDCMMLYQMRKALFSMWAPGTGNGSCAGQIQVAGGAADQAAELPPQPISIGGGRAGGGNGNPAYSMASGKVFDDAVKAVKVTWQDGTSQQADVINASYLIVHTGEVDWMNVEALDEKGNVVYNWKPAVAPGKK